MTIRRSTSDIDLGFGKYNYEIDKPRVQILTPKPTPKRLQIRVCTRCNGQVTWIKEAQRFICYSCGIFYHEDFFESLPTSNDASIKPLQSNSPYEQIQPAIVSAKRDNSLQGQHNDPLREITKVSGDGRKVSVRVKGSPALVTEEWIRSQLGKDEVS